MSWCRQYGLASADIGPAYDADKVVRLTMRTRWSGFCPFLILNKIQAFNPFH